MPTFRNRVREEVIDVTLSNRADMVKDWRVDSGYSYSDHSLIYFCLDFVGPRRVPYRNPRRTDWGHFGVEVERGLGILSLDGSTLSEVNRVVDRFTEICVGSYERSCPRVYPGRRTQPCWWTTELGSLRREVRRLFNRAKTTCLGSDWDVYRNCFNRYKRDIKRAKRTSWKSFCESIDSVNELSRFRRVLSRGHSAFGNIQRADGSWAESGSESLALLLDVHFPGSREVDIGESVMGRSVVATEEERLLVADMVTLEKVTWAVQSFGSYKSPGPDGIFPAMLQNVSSRTLLLLVEVFRTCLIGRFIPMAWREVRVIFLPKAGRACHSVPGDFRPISLSSFLLKTMERVIDLYLRGRIDRGVFSGAQHAYMRGRSVETALHEVVGHIEKGLHYGLYTLAAFLDIEGAFNNVENGAIGEALVELGVQDFIVEWIVSMLKGRIIHSELGGVCLRRSVSRGTPQGGVLSPLLWNIVVDGILRSFLKEGRKVVCYADDVVILVTGKFLPTVSEVMQSALCKLSSWASVRGLSVNPAKTELVLFSRKYKTENFVLPKLGGVELRLSDGAKYLGVFLDRKLSWKENTMLRMRKGLNAYYAVRCAIGGRWGLRPRVVRWIYDSVVMPVLTYGCIVWWEALGRASRRGVLGKVQRCVSLGISGASRSTPQASLDMILGLVPLEEAVKKLAARAFLRIFEGGLAKIGEYGHATILRVVNLGIPGTIRPGFTDYMVRVCDFDRMPSVIFPSRERWQGADRLMDVHAVFTDGSKTETGTGAGVCMFDSGMGLSYRLPDECSVFQAEVYAVFRATELIREHIATGEKVAIYVDSQAAIRALTGRYVSSRLVAACRKSLSMLLDEYGIWLCWVPGHCEVAGNEAADELARDGAGKNVDLADGSVRPPLGFFVGRIDQYVLRRVEGSWRRRSDCRISRMLWPRWDRSRTNWILGLNRVPLRTLIGFLTGHCNVRARTRLWDRGSPDFCRLCGNEGEPETVEHILCVCPRLQGRRLRIFGQGFFGGLSEVASVRISDLEGFIAGFGWLVR